MLPWAAFIIPKLTILGERLPGFLLAIAQFKAARREQREYAGTFPIGRKLPACHVDNDGDEFNGQPESAGTDAPNGGRRLATLTGHGG